MNEREQEVKLAELLKENEFVDAQFQVSPPIPIMNPPILLAIERIESNFPSQIKIVDPVAISPDRITIKFCSQKAADDLKVSDFWSLRNQHWSAAESIVDEYGIRTGIGFIVIPRFLEFPTRPSVKVAIDSMQALSSQSLNFSERDLILLKSKLKDRAPVLFRHFRNAIRDASFTPLLHKMAIELIRDAVFDLVRGEGSAETEKDEKLKWTVSTEKLGIPKASRVEKEELANLVNPIKHSGKLAYIDGPKRLELLRDLTDRIQRLVTFLKT